MKVSIRLPFNDFRSISKASIRLPNDFQMEVQLPNGRNKTKSIEFKISDFTVMSEVAEAFIHSYMYVKKDFHLLPPTPIPFQ